jgi:GNAT superfamily N-acetyltransferase
VTTVPYPSVELRPYAVGDEPAVLALLGASLGWLPDELHARLFAWKHTENPFGVSPAWVATVAGQVVGFRTFLRWEFETGPGGAPVRAVRAVDTATHPDHQGKGVFRALTEHALDALRDDGVAFVFNTPNERSRPGYLRMGWHPVRRLPVLARPASVRSVVRLVRARTPAEKWSVASAAGMSAPAALGDGSAVDVLLGSAPGPGMRTCRSVAYLTWRYGFEPLRYRAVVGEGGPSEGIVIFRLRRRGPAIEAAVCEELVPGGDPARTRRLLGLVLRTSGADYAVRLGDHLPRAGFVRLPRQGPTLTGREVCNAVPDAAAWRLGLGDIELF